MKGWKSGRVGGREIEWEGGRVGGMGKVEGWKGRGRVDEWIDERMEEWKNGRVKERLGIN